MEKLPDELAEKLQKVADDQNVVLMSFIAPDITVRKSPSSFDYASIKVSDLYRIEAEIDKIKSAGGSLRKLHLIIQTPGGELTTSTKIADYLQTVFGENIDAYVPYEAASGGTLLCLAAKHIVMCSTSNLTPIDPQIIYRFGRISATSYEQAINEFKRDYGNLRPEEIPSPYQQMASQFDPVTSKEMSKVVWDTLNVAYKFLLKSQNPKTDEEKQKMTALVFSLGKTDWPHSHVISLDEAKKIGLNIDENANQIELLNLYKRWVAARLNEEQENHIIDVFYPKQKTNETETQPASTIPAQTTKQEKREKP